MTRNRGFPGGAVAALAVLVFFTLASGPHRRSQAADGDANLREAAKHFQQGVAFYGEADYRSALVEFKRAAVLAPSAAVLYNIAETEYQLRDYAGAMRTFDRYLTSVGPSDPHRGEVEGNIKLLRARVGRLNIATTPAGADVTVDDQPVGRTPFRTPLIVNVGHLKVVATASGHLPVTQYVDVAAEDSVAMSLELASPEPSQGPLDLRLSGSGSPGGPPPHRPWVRPLGWVGAGVLAVGAIGFGLLAHQESNDLRDARSMFGVMKDHLDDLSARATTYAVLSDVLTVSAIALGAWTFFFATPGGSSERAASAQLIVGPSSAGLRGTFY